MTAITAFFMVFRRLPSTFLTFPNVLQTMFEGHTNAAEHFLKKIRRLPKIAEVFRGRPEDVLIIHQRIHKYNLKDKLDISEIIDIFTNEDMEMNGK